MAAALPCQQKAAPRWAVRPVAVALASPETKLSRCASAARIVISFNTKCVVARRSKRVVFRTPLRRRSEGPGPDVVRRGKQRQMET